MDLNTKHIVASNLTIAKCANHPSPSEDDLVSQLEVLSEEDVFEVYRRFLSLLDAQEKADSSGFKQTPGLPI